MVQLKASDQLIEKGNLNTLRVIKDFQYVFSEEISGLPPHRDIDFTIDLVLGTIHVSRASY